MMKKIATLFLVLLLISSLSGVSAIESTPTKDVTDMGIELGDEFLSDENGVKGFARVPIPSSPGMVAKGKTKCTVYAAYTSYTDFWVVS